MAEWDCNAKVIGIGETISHEINLDYGITVMLQDVSPAGSHKAIIDVFFYWDKDPDRMRILGPGESESYTDDTGREWTVQVDRTVYAGAGSTAGIQVCYEEAAPAEGQIMSIDVPASASEGDRVDLCATIKNIGGTTAKFFLRFYNGATMVRETLPGNVAAGQTIVNVCERFTMPSTAWSGKIELIRQE